MGEHTPSQPGPTAPPFAVGSPVASSPPPVGANVSDPLRAEPFFFAPAGAPLYGVYHPPRVERRGAAVVVHCHTIGVEQVTSCRPETLHARAVAEAGHAAMRYHARGHGDSSGDFAAVTLDTLVEDAVAAAREACRRAGRSKVVWVGVRFGALVAARAAVAMPEASVAGIALWEPVQRVRDYVRAMLRNLLFSEVAHGRRPAATVDELLAQLASEGRVDVHGYYLHRPLFDSAADLELGGLLRTWRGPTFLAQVQRRNGLAPAHAALVRDLEARGCQVTTALIGEEPGWHFISNPAWEGTDLVRRSAEWVYALA
jgi:alpha/beta superfamily hydrolase